MTVIAVGNHKGGVTKTTTTAQLAASFARRGFRVLAVDADAQHQLTYFLYRNHEIDLDLQDILIGGKSPQEVIKRTAFDRLDVLPSTLAVAELDMDLLSQPKREDRMRWALEQVQDSYDFVVIDLPPALSITVATCLNAATDIIVPVDTTYFGLQSLVSFKSWTDRYREIKVVAAPILGVLATKFDPRNTAEQDVLAALLAYRSAGRGLPLFDTVMPKRTAAEKNVTAGILVGDSRMHRDLAEAYEDLTEEVLGRLEHPRKGDHR